MHHYIGTVLCDGTWALHALLDPFSKTWGQGMVCWKKRNTKKNRGMLPQIRVLKAQIPFLIANTMKMVMMRPHTALGNGNGQMNLDSSAADIHRKRQYIPTPKEQFKIKNEPRKLSLNLDLE